jgi:hypothetical protein
LGAFLSVGSNTERKTSLWSNINYIIIIKPTTMQRKDFIKNTVLCAVAISATGFIRFDGKHYIGDCETVSSP